MKCFAALTAVSLLFAGSAFAQEQASAAPAPDAPVAPTTEAPATGTPAPQPGEADPSVYQVLRPGDRQMTCEQLSAEANTLNAQLLAEQKAAAKRKGASRAGRQVAGGVAGGALKGAGRMGIGRMLGGMTPFGGLVALAASDAAADAAGQAIARGGEGQAEPSITPQQQRMNHLLGLYREKAC